MVFPTWNNPEQLRIILPKVILVAMLKNTTQMTLVNMLFLFIFFFFLGLHLWHVEVPMLGVESEL